MMNVKPEEVGISSIRLKLVDRFIEQSIYHQLIPGAVILIARHGKIAHLKALGKMDIENDKQMLNDCLFRLYSMSKPVISTALMMLYEEGHFQLFDPVSKFIPSFKNLQVFKTGDERQWEAIEPVREITIKDLLIHTSGSTHYLATYRLLIGCIEQSDCIQASL